jgi:hypothetical protein
MPVFEGVLEPGPSGGAYVAVPDDVLGQLGGKARGRVRGHFGEVEFRSSLAAMGGGRACVGVHKATRVAAGVDFGQAVRVELDRDEEPRPVWVPVELAEALGQDSALQAAFDAASPSRQREWAGSVGEAKRDETRRRRVARIVDELRGVRSRR